MYEVMHSGAWHGKVGGQFESFTMLLLTTTGAKSRQPRLSPWHTTPSMTRC
jgi:hypothetical protein